MQQQIFWGAICARQKLWARVRGTPIVTTLVAIILGVVLALPATATEKRRSPRAGVIFIGNDRGGVIRHRVAEIEDIRKSGLRVAITGSVCLSSCTMYLGVAGTCVSPRTTFGFHGPSRSGRPLTQKQFEHWSRVMASFYPEPIQSWYLGTARNRIQGYYKLTGRDLIRMGVPACSA